MTARNQALLWLAQRLSAMLLALCVVVHLITIVYAVRSGLSATEILGRTRGSHAWFAFYAVFVVAVAVHASIGLRTIASEMLSWRGTLLDWSMAAVGIALAWGGMRAVFGVFVA